MPERTHELTALHLARGDDPLAVGMAVWKRYTLAQAAVASLTRPRAAVSRRGPSPA